MAFIYRAVRIGTDRCYVGRTKNHLVWKRWRSHRIELRKGKHPSPHFQNAWNKYGESAFDWEVLEECHEVKMIEREQFYIDTLNSCYNFSRNAASPSNDPIIRAKAVANMIAAVSAMTPEQRRARAHKPDGFGKTMAAALVGKLDTPARRASQEINMKKMLEASPANKPGWIPTHRVGVKDSPEVVEKRRQSKLAAEQRKREAGIKQIWITDGTETKMILASDVIPEGWQQGRNAPWASRPQGKRSDIARENMRQAQLRSNTERKANGLPHPIENLRFKWVTDGITSLRLRYDAAIPEGFCPGRVF